MRTVLFGVLLVLLSPLPSLATPPTDSPLIPRTALFGAATNSRAVLSPDGLWLAWITPRDGVEAIWVARTAHPSDAHPLLTDKTPPVREFYWAPDSSGLLIISDTDGDENYALYRTDLATGQMLNLTPFKNVSVELAGISNQITDRVLITLNKRDPQWPDLYSVSLKTGELTPVLLNTDHYADFITDQSLTLRQVMRSLPDGANEFAPVIDNTVDDRHWEAISALDARTTGPDAYSTDGKTLYWLDSRNRNTVALVAQDLASGKMTVIGQDPKADIDQVLNDPQSGRAQAFRVNYAERKWTVIDPTVKPDLDLIKAQLGDSFTVTSRTTADDLWTIDVDQNAKPTATYLYRRPDRQLTRLFVEHPDLDHAALAPMHALTLKARDGTPLVSYLTLPKESDPRGSGRPDHPLPLVLLVHGGPWWRDSSEFNVRHQWLANRGYAVLSVNFRGSSGFGKSFLKAGNLEWGGKMQNDLLDAVDWAVASGIARKDRLAIMGSGYGGYAALVGLTFTPDRFACAVDINGPSNLITLTQTLPASWAYLKPTIYGNIGDPTNKEGKTLLHDRSPLFKAPAITHPLLILQGANDPRVRRAESDQIVTFMNAHAIPVTYVLFPDEGEDFARPANRIAVHAITEQFLAKYLEGRAEPLGDSIRQSSTEVIEGAEYVPGLKEAARR